MPRYYRNEAEKRSFIRSIFDSTAGDYDTVEQGMALGTGSWYRRRALNRSGLKPGMRVLDVACGTGLVAREAIRIIGDPTLLVGLDPSPGMLKHALTAIPDRRTTGKPARIMAVQALAERIPLADNTFDFLSLGYALRHLSDLVCVFAEFYRVLKPGGRVCILEITRPESRVGLSLLRGYMKWLVPALVRIRTGHARTQLLWRYYWETIEACIPPQTVLQALEQAGFVQVRRFVELGIFSEYTACKPPV